MNQKIIYKLVEPTGEEISLNYAIDKARFNLP